VPESVRFRYVIGMWCKICHTPATTNQHPDEFHDYLQSTAESSNCVEFWQQHKDTEQLHMRHHIIPAMSVGIGRDFNLARITCSDRRNSRIRHGLYRSPWIRTYCVIVVSVGYTKWRVVVIFKLCFTAANSN